MQISGFVGTLIAFGSLCLSILIDTDFHFGAILSFFNVSAMIIIIGGVTGVIILAFPVSHLKEIPFTLKKAFMHYHDIEIVSMSAELLSMAQKARQEGILAMEKNLSTISDSWMRMGIQLVVDGLDKELVKAIMNSKLDEYTEKNGIGSKIFAQLGGFAPTLGIIGTVMGLVHMLANLEDSSKIGGAIAVAFLATFWGILTANLIFLPIANRVKTIDAHLVMVREVMIEGILSIQAGEPMRVLEERLKVFMNEEELARFELAKVGTGAPGGKGEG